MTTASPPWIGVICRIANRNRIGRSVPQPTHPTTTLMAPSAERPNSCRARDFAAFAVVLCGLACVEGSPPAAPEIPRPNIILIVADTLRADYLGYHGFRGDISPSIDGWAQESVRFLNAMSSAPWTKPSIATLFTSLDPDHHGMLESTDPVWRFPTPLPITERLSDEAVTLAEVLRESGYKTAARVSNPWLMDSNGFAQGFDLWQDANHGGVGGSAEIIEVLGGLDGNQPFFLYLHFMGAHGPYRVAPKDEMDFERLRGSPSLGGSTPMTLAQQELRDPYLGWELEWAGGPKGEDLLNWKAAYANGVLRLDRKLAPLFEWLRASGILATTMVVFTSDHGEEFLEHAAWGHGFRLCGHQLHVPLLIRMPGLEPSPSEVRRPVGIIDLMPTLLSVARAGPPPAVSQGTDLSPLLQGNRMEDSPLYYASGVKGHPNLFSIRNERFKIIADIQSSAASFYDLDSDPEEQAAATHPPEQPVRLLTNSLSARIHSNAKHTWREEVSEQMPKETIDALKALGYLNPKAQPRQAR